MWVLGCTCLPGCGQCALEFWGFPELRPTEATAASLAHVLCQDAGRRSLRDGPHSLLCKEFLVGALEGGGDNPWLPQQGMGFPISPTGIPPKMMFVFLYVKLSFS